MERRPLALAEVLVVVTVIVLAAIGNLAGNLVSEVVPSALSHFALPAVGLTAFLEVTVALLLGNQQGFQRNQRLRRATILLIVLGEVLALAGGILSNLASASLPPAHAAIAFPLFVVVGMLVVLVSIFTYIRQTTPPIEVTDRDKFMRKLRSSYRLEDTLHGAVLLALELDQAPKTLTRPVLALGTPHGLEEPGDAHSLDDETRIDQVFDDANGRLLILGAPGAGKTTLLVELAIVLLGRAQIDAKANMKTALPIIFNLSTWVHNRKPLREWMIEDLRYTHKIPRSVAQKWFDAGEVLPLLDGFDEVEEGLYATCALTINAFAREHPALPVVVCSRSAAYSEQPVGLDQLKAAVVIRPLTDEQVLSVLASGSGQHLTSLRATVNEFADLRDLLRSPLLLNLVMLTYGRYDNLPDEAIPPVGNHDAWVRALFQDYTARMLGRKRMGEQEALYQPEETERYLAWLAFHMRNHRSVAFSMRRLEENWLPDMPTRRRYRIQRRLVTSLVGGLMAGSVAAAAGALSIEALKLVVSFSATIIQAIGAEGGVGVFLGLVGGLLAPPVMNLFMPGSPIAYSAHSHIGAEIVTIGGVMQSNRRGRNSGRGGSGYRYALLSQLLRSGLASGLIIGLLAGLVFGPRIGSSLVQLVTLPASFLAVHVIEPAMRFIANSFADLRVSLVIGLTAAFLIGLTVGLCVALGRTFTRKLFALVTRISKVLSWPVKVVLALLRIVLTSGLVAGVFLGALIGLLFGTLNVLNVGLLLGFLLALLFGLLFDLLRRQSGRLLGGLIDGMESIMNIISSLMLRKALQRSHVMPPHFTRFLDYCAGHILLQRANAGYRFIHLLLRDYFADLFETSHSSPRL